ncbi:MAG: hypothetical protein ACAH88_09615, partial [Roseimicrobium sp.]
MQKTTTNCRHSRFSLPRAATAAIICAAFFAPQMTFAATAVWNGATDAVWATPTNWNTSLVPGTGDTATFNNAGNGNTVVSLGAGVTLNTLLFDTANAASYVIGSGAVGSQTLILDNGGAITMNAALINNQLINAAIVLGADATAQAYTFTNNSAAMV